MRPFKWLLCIFLIPLYQFQVTVKARNVYDSHVEREDNAPGVPVYAKKKFLKEELTREASDDMGGEIQDYSNSMYESPHLRQYEPEYYQYPAAARGMLRQNPDNTPYDVKNREYYPDMKTGKDSQLQVVLDPKSRKAVAVIDNQQAQENYMNDMNWKNQREDIYDNEQYSQNGQDQLVNVVYPTNRNDRKYARNIGDTGNLENTQMNLNQRKAPDYNSPGQYKNLNLQDSSLKMKRHTNIEKKEMENKRTIKNTDATIKERQTDQNIEHNEKPNKNKRSTSGWSNEQIQSLRDSLGNLLENSAEYDNVKYILKDMGLVEKDAKREVSSKEDYADADDENLNSKNIIMRRNDKKWQSDETDPEPIEKRDLEEVKEDTESEDEEQKVKKRSDKIKKNTGGEGDKHGESENEDSERRRRNYESENMNGPDMMKGLEKSGELSVSGNKSPLAQDEKNEADGKELTLVADKDAVDKRNVNEDADYDQRIESEIQAKIDAIKEKVKREIMFQKQKRQTSRIKRSATLLDSEDKSINPDLMEYDSMQPHIRTRRDTENNSSTSNEMKNNVSKLNEEMGKLNVTKLFEEFLEVEDVSLKPHVRKRRDTSSDKIKEDQSKITNEQLVKQKIVNDDENTQSNNDKLPSLIRVKRQIVAKEDTLEPQTLGQQNKVLRRKRANNVLPENKMVFRQYLSPQDEEEEAENGEFDNIYDQPYVEKREAFDPDYQYFDKDTDQSQEYLPENSNYPAPVRRQARSHSGYQEGNYEPSASNFRNYQSRYHSRGRNKRNNEVSQMHGGGMLSSRKSSKSNKDNSEDRNKYANARNVENSEDSDDSDNEFFGGLPQNYQEAELNRYKRVKRTNDKKKP